MEILQAITNSEDSIHILVLFWLDFCPNYIMGTEVLEDHPTAEYATELKWLN